MRSTDFLIVGGGIAGLTLAESFDSEGADFLLVDLELPGRSTGVSAGLINPVTGMRFVLSWNYAALENEFLLFYKEMEAKYKVHLLSELPIYQRLYLEMDANAWMARCADPHYEKYISGLSKVPFVETGHLQNRSYGKIEKGYRLHIEELLTVVRNFLKSSSRFIGKKFEYRDVKVNSEKLSWKDVEIRKAIIFAEGYKVKDNPYFNKLPLMPLKGDCTLFYAEDLHWEFVLKDSYSVIPLGQQYYWCGSHFSMNDLAVEVDPEEIVAQAQFLKELLPCPYRIVDHMSGIRPAVKDRKPLLGRHPHDPRIVIFNGLGTKGASLAPFCAHRLKNALLYDSEIPKELSIDRFHIYFEV